MSPLPFAGEGARSARHDRRRLDLHARGALDETHHLHQRHRRIMRTEHVAIGFAEFFQAAHIFFDIDDIPGEADQVLRPGAAFGKDVLDVLQRLTDLADEIRLQLSSASQPITPPVTTIRPSAIMPLA